MNLCFGGWEVEMIHKIFHKQFRIFWSIEAAKPANKLLFGLISWQGVVCKGWNFTINKYIFLYSVKTILLYNV